LFCSCGYFQADDIDIIERFSPRIESILEYLKKLKDACCIINIDTWDGRTLGATQIIAYDNGNS
jgi:hypothetical protein